MKPVNCMAFDTNTLTLQRPIQMSDCMVCGLPHAPVYLFTGALRSRTALATSETQSDVIIAPKLDLDGQQKIIARGRRRQLY